MFGTISRVKPGTTLEQFVFGTQCIGALGPGFHRDDKLLYASC